MGDVDISAATIEAMAARIEHGAAMAEAMGEPRFVETAKTTRLNAATLRALVARLALVDAWARTGDDVALQVAPICHETDCEEPGEKRTFERGGRAWDWCRKHAPKGAFWAESTDPDVRSWLAARVAARGGAT